jgi:myo-inositol 2-dehydrogenase/D-chiro-inositol 1-dehydrogenase
MSDQLRFGVIGAGRIGRLHIEHLMRRIPNTTVSVVSDVVRKAADSAAAEFGVPRVVGDAKELIRSPEVDAVVICSSTDTHAEFMIESARAGKHVFCEKPIALDLDAIDSALEEVDRAGVKLQIGFNRRFDSNYRRVWEHIGAGDVGDLHMVHIVSRDPAPPPIDYVKVSGGIFLDMAIHDFDMSRYLVGDEPETVYAVGGVRIDPQIGEAGDVDTAVCTLTFRNGVYVTIDNSRQAVFGYDQRVEAFGSGGMVRIDNNAENNAVLSTATAVQSDLPLNFFMERYIDSYIAELQAFVAAIENDEPTPVNGVDGRIPIIMGYAATKSLAEGRPVRMDEIAKM